MLVNSSDVVLRHALENANKAAASQHIPIDGKSGGGTISYTDAEAKFAQVLASDLILDPSLAPKKGSVLTSTPDYKLLIYNGVTTEDAPSGVIYEYKNGSFYASEIPYEGFPQTFDVGQDITVTLNNPGVIGIIKAKTKSIFGNDITTERWAAAEVKNQQGQSVVLLLGKNIP